MLPPPPRDSSSPGHFNAFRASFFLLPRVLLRSWQGHRTIDALAICVLRIPNLTEEGVACGHYKENENEQDCNCSTY